MIQDRALGPKGTYLLYKVTSIIIKVCVLILECTLLGQDE